MAVTAYATADELAAWLRIDDTDENTHLDDVLLAARTDIDAFCGRPFDEAHASDTSTRQFRARWCDLIYIDPAAAVTALAVDTSGNGSTDITWTSADYQLEPVNQIAQGLNDHPYTHIRAIRSLTFPVTNRAAVHVTARWGWDTVPPAVKTAALMHAGRLHERRNHPLALVGDVAARSAMGLDNDVKARLEPFRRVDLWT